MPINLEIDHFKGKGKKETTGLSKSSIQPIPSKVISSHYQYSAHKHPFKVIFKHFSMFIQLGAKSKIQGKKKQLYENTCIFTYIFLTLLHNPAIPHKHNSSKNPIDYYINYAL